MGTGMRKRKQSYQEVSGVSDSTGKQSPAIGGGDNEEHDAKRSTAIGGDDDKNGNSDTNFGWPFPKPYDYRLPSSDEDDDELESDPLLIEFLKLPVYDLDVLKHDIKHFDTDPSILDKLKNRVASDIDDEKIWFTELRKVWKGTESREEAARLIMNVLHKINSGVTNSRDLRGFLEHYGLPSIWELNPNWLDRWTDMSYFRR